MATPQLPCTKGQANRAGEVLRTVWTTAPRDGSWDGVTRQQVSEAFATADLWRQHHARPLAKVNANLRYWIRKVGAEPEVTQRLKRFATIIHKLVREPGMELSRMEDIGGVRALLPTQQHILDIAESLDKARHWTIRRRRFYIDNMYPGPKDDGYRAVHLIVVKDDVFIEMQLRTPGQDSWAQSVEQDTRRLRAGLKFGAGPDDLRQYYVLVSDFIAMREQAVEPSPLFMDRLAELYAATRKYFPPGTP